MQRCPSIIIEATHFGPDGNPAVGVRVQLDSMARIYPVQKMILDMCLARVETMGFGEKQILTGAQLTIDQSVRIVKSREVTIVNNVNEPRPTVLVLENGSDIGWTVPVTGDMVRVRVCNLADTAK